MAGRATDLPRFAAAGLVVASLLCAAGPAGSSLTAPPTGEPEPVETGPVEPGPVEPDASYAEAIDVSLVTLVVRVVDSWGNPVLGLAPADFRVRVGKRETPVLALDWVTPGPAAPAAAAADSPAGTAVEETSGTPPSEQAIAPPLPARSPPTRTAPGRLVVVFVQADLNPTRISGQLRLRPYTRELFATLHPGDHVAVVSFDSHLKLWQDFSPSPEATHAAIDRAMLYSREVEVPPSAPHSLVRNVDRIAARDAASPERALELIGRAMTPLPGEKTLIYLGWGLGRFGGDGVKMTPAFAPAVRALRAARTAVFVLDVTSADAHSLAVGLESVAEATGGMYLSTFRLPGVATRSLGRTLAGYYLLTLDRDALAGADASRLRIQLRSRQGTVLARPLALR